MNITKLLLLTFLVLFLIGSNDCIAESKTSIDKAGNIVNFDPTKSQEPEYVKNEFIIKFKKNIIDLNSVIDKENKLKVFEKEKAIEPKKEIKDLNIRVYKTLTKTTNERIQELKYDSNIEYIEPNYIRKIDDVPNDTHINSQWAFNNYGQTVNGLTGISGSDIKINSVWNYESSYQPDIVVAVLDTGVAYNHPDLINNMWDGSNCVDASGNFLGGCLYGYDFEDNDKDPMPIDQTHGTHIAGIIAAESNNSLGVSGVSKQNNIKIMALKFGLTTAEELEAISFAKTNGAKVINMSFGSASFSQAEKDAIDSFSGLVVAAAGNDSSNNDLIPFYPSGCTCANIISVAASNQNDSLASFSNYGATSVDIAAPGENILSTITDETGFYVLSENFNEVMKPNIPNGWTKTGNTWGTYYLDDSVKNVLYGDLNYPYLNNTNNTVTSGTYNLNTSKSASIEFIARCDTEYNTSSWNDYMALEVSGDGSNFTEISRWNEVSLDTDNDPANAVVQLLSISLPQKYLTSNFKFRYRWVTNGSDNDYDGCLVDNINLRTFNGGVSSLVGYLDGTSMASPYIAGIAGYLWSYNPNLSTAQIKSNILTSGDVGVGFSGKLVSSARVNVQKALTNTIRFPDVPTSNNFYSYIENLVTLGVVTGYPEGLFKPGDNVTRGAMAKFIKNAFGFETDTSCGDFKDVPSNNNFYSVITTLKCKGVINGFPEGDFRPDDIVDRGSAMKFIINGARKKTGDENFLPKTQDDVFLDLKRTDNFYEYIMAGYSNGIINGYPDGYFRSTVVTDRGAMSKMVDNTRKKLP